jgi:hypothetical protein
VSATGIEPVTAGCKPAAAQRCAKQRMHRETAKRKSRVMGSLTHTMREAPPRPSVDRGSPTRYYLL